MTAFYAPSKDCPNLNVQNTLSLLFHLMSWTKSIQGSYAGSRSQGDSLMRIEKAVSLDFEFLNGKDYFTRGVVFAKEVIRLEGTIISPRILELSVIGSSRLL